MLLILLPGMDGTGIMFDPLLKALPSGIQVKVIAYPCDTALSYKELVLYVQDRLPENKDFVLLAESFSGPIAYEIARQMAKENNEHLKRVIFVASFIGLPNRLLRLVKILPLNFLFSGIIPDFILKILIGDFKNKYALELLKNSLDKVSPDILSYRIKEMSGLPINIQGRINKSVYIQAISDRLVSSGNSDIIKNISTKFRLYRVEGSHFICQVNPEKCALIIEHEINDSVIQGSKSIA